MERNSSHSEDKVLGCASVPRETLEVFVSVPDVQVEARVTTWVMVVAITVDAVVKIVVVQCTVSRGETSHRDAQVLKSILWDPSIWQCYLDQHKEKPKRQRTSGQQNFMPDALNTALASGSENPFRGILKLWRLVITKTRPNKTGQYHSWHIRYPVLSPQGPVISDPCCISGVVKSAKARN